MIVMSVREMCVEWSGGFPPVNDPAMQGQKDPKGGFNIEVQPLHHSKHLLHLVDHFRFRGETPVQAALSCTLWGSAPLPLFLSFWSLMVMMVSFTVMS